MKTRTAKSNDAIEERFRETMKKLTRELDIFFNGDDPKRVRTIGFLLMVFPLGTTDHCDYISNCGHDEMISLMKTMTDRFGETKGTA